MEETLLQIKAHYDELGFSTNLIPKSATTPAQQLLVYPGKFNNGTPIQLEIMLIPDSDERFMMHLFVPLTSGIVEAKIEDTSRIILLLNEQLPLNGFGLSEKQSLIYYRYMMPGKVQEDIIEILEATVGVILYCSKTFGDVVCDLSHDLITAKAARIIIEEKIIETQHLMELGRSL